MPLDSAASDNFGAAFCAAFVLTCRGPLDDYQLIVIDEAHAYRNPDAPGRAQVLRRLLMGPRRDVVLMSATPVNNSLWDLYHLLRYFVKQDALFADRGVRSLRDRFEEAMAEDPFSLSPDLLYPVIDATTVKRTRRFVKRHYENDLLTLPDGRRVPIRFPKANRLDDQLRAGRGATRLRRPAGGGADAQPVEAGPV